MTQMIFDLEKLRRVPIYNILGLTKQNKKVKIRCPFHHEKTPSCVLFPDGGFHCFGCGARGNSIDFITKMGYSFEEACKELNKHL